MEDVNLGQLLICSWVLLGFGGLAFLGYLFAVKKMNGDRFKRFLGVLTICILSAMFPMGPFGLIFGAPSVFLASILITLFLDKKSA